MFNALNAAGIGFESFKDGVMWEEEFLTKDLMIHWQWGERWFMRQLVDGDQAANKGADPFAEFGGLPGGVVVLGSAA